MPNPIDLNSDIAVGIQFPLQNGAGGFFNQSYTTIDQVKSNIRNLLLTMKGERLMQPSFGSDLMNIIFEPINDNTIDRIKISIKEALDEWLPFVTIVDFNVEILNQDVSKNTINVDLVFYILDDSNITQTVNLNFETII